MIVLELEEFVAAGDIYLRCKSEEQRYLFNHLLGGKLACRTGDEANDLINLATAHGWVVKVNLS